MRKRNIAIVFSSPRVRAAVVKLLHAMAKKGNFNEDICGICQTSQVPELTLQYNPLDLSDAHLPIELCGEYDNVSVTCELFVNLWT